MSLLAAHGPVFPAEKGRAQATILRVVDGVTYRVEYKGEEESLRLIGVSTPDSRVNRRAMREAQKTGEDMRAIDSLIAQGRETMKFVRTLVKRGDGVTLEFDAKRRDPYKRILAYVFLRDGRMLNEEILRNGYGNPMVIPPNKKYQQRFRAAYEEARKKKRGLWRE